MPRGLFGAWGAARQACFDPYGGLRGAAWITHSMEGGEHESPPHSPDLAPKGVAR